MDSQGHCLKILSDNLTKFGINLNLAPLSVIGWNKSGSTLCIRHKKNGFVHLRFKTINMKNKLEAGFLVEMSDLIKLGIQNQSDLPFFNECLDLKSIMRSYATAAYATLSVIKYYLYLPLDGSEPHYTFVFDTLNNYLFVSNIPELETNPIEFLKNKYIPDFNRFIAVDSNFKQSVEELFFNIYQNTHKNINEHVTRGDFLVAMMEAI